MGKHIERVKVMFERKFRNVTGLQEAMKALDSLDKTYIVTKSKEYEEEVCLRTGNESIIRRHDPQHEYPVWTVTETAEVKEEKKESCVGNLTIKVDADFSGFEEKLEKVREMLSAPLSDFVTVVIDNDRQ